MRKKQQEKIYSIRKKDFDDDFVLHPYHGLRVKLVSTITKTWKYINDVDVSNWPYDALLDLKRNGIKSIYYNRKAKKPDLSVTQKR